MRKKIAFVTPIYLPANLFGSDFFVKIMAENLAASGYDVSIITSNALTPQYWYDKFSGEKIKKKYETIKKVNVIRLECNQSAFVFFFILSKVLSYIAPKRIVDKFKLKYSGPYLENLTKTIAKGGYDIIHCSPFPLFINKQVVEALEKVKKKPKLILTPFYHTEVRDYINPELKKILDKSVIIHAVSNTEKNEIVRRFNIPREKIIVIPLFVDLTSLHSQTEILKDIQALKKQYFLENRFLILFAGIKGTMKGACDLLFSVNNLYKKNKKFLLVAIGHNTTEWERVKNKINKNCLLDFSYVNSYKKELFFTMCDVFCMPSKSESFGLVYLEAWHKKKPVIGANIESVKELIEKNKGGLLVEYGNIDKLENTILQLYTDTSLRNSLGVNGYKTLMSKYTFDILFTKYVKLFYNM